ncbi:hypothetical protein AZ34_10455 [Hylemonella gracilis str. Niagara R]|uniref:Phage virion morphogenesis protein n=1 Tax=Hylemonella gracilis str. Niagara R TaxID=1458275 RepID=A0A016XJQ9_9BURK|nr:phage virion morphogenesis protein [Hylemonella gracilis]EYC51453.1 hypothetical protein AZ34_10455 [Hylemonella gracilis str. Niagara R]
MDDSLQELATWAAPLVATLSDSARRRLLRRIATALADRQARRIRRQQNPDGSPFEPRKKASAARAALGRSVRARAKASGPMFEKLRQRQHLKAANDAAAATVGFLGRAARIARIHQLGLLDAPAPGQAGVRYPARELLGLTSTDRAMVRDFVLDALAHGRAAR